MHPVVTIPTLYIMPHGGSRMAIVEFGVGQLISQRRVGMLNLVIVSFFARFPGFVHSLILGTGVISSALSDDAGMGLPFIMSFRYPLCSIVTELT
jgi:hypothetical protein